MDKKDRLLKEAANEIRNLRAHNERMRERLYMFDSVMLLVRGRESGMNGAMHPDLVYEIDKCLEESMDGKKEAIIS